MTGTPYLLANAAPHASARIETRWGEGVRQTTVVEAGDFLDVAPGVPHHP